MPQENVIRRDVFFRQSRERVWKAIASRDGLAQWMFPNDFEPRVGHQFTFSVPGKPEMNFEGLTVRCEVLACEPPSHLQFSWSAGPPVEDTWVSLRLEEEEAGTRLHLEHAGFDLEHPFGRQAFAGANYGWAGMLEKLESELTAAGTLRTERVVMGRPEDVLNAFRQADLLAKWWGPEGFTNTFETFEFQPGGRWVYTMHGPEGRDYPNESVFRETGPERIVIEHVAKPTYRLTIVLAPEGENETRVTWTQVFDNAQFVENAREFLTQANEQNLDRLDGVVQAN